MASSRASAARSLSRCWTVGSFGILKVEGGAAVQGRWTEELDAVLVGGAAGRLAAPRLDDAGVVLVAGALTGASPRLMPQVTGAILGLWAILLTGAMLSDADARTECEK
jgi:hypothetical protein